MIHTEKIELLGAWYRIYTPEPEPINSDFRLSESVDYYVSNPESGVILSYLNDKIKIVVIQKSALYTDGHLVVILSACALPENGLRERLSHYNKQY